MTTPSFFFVDGLLHATDTNPTTDVFMRHNPASFQENKFPNPMHSDFTETAVTGQATNKRKSSLLVDSRPKLTKSENYSRRKTTFWGVCSYKNRYNGYINNPPSPFESHHVLQPREKWQEKKKTQKWGWGWCGSRFQTLEPWLSHSLEDVLKKNGWFEENEEKQKGICKH